MKMIKKCSLVLLTIALASSTQANSLVECPDISGTFLCKENTYRVDTLYNFSRKIQNGYWQYEMKTRSLESGLDLAIFQFLADAQEQVVVDQISGQSLSLQATCANQLLQVRGNFKTPAGLQIHFSEDLSLDQDRHLSNISLDIQGNIVQEICQRQ